MNITELIKELEYYREKFGDLNVFTTLLSDKNRLELVDIEEYSFDVMSKEQLLNIEIESKYRSDPVLIIY